MAKPAAETKSTKQPLAKKRTTAQKPVAKRAPVKKVAPESAVELVASKATTSRRAVKAAVPVSTASERAPRRDRGKRHLGQDARRANVDPSQIIKVSKSKALPGENEILTYTPGRGPITEQEALGRLRRAERMRMATAAGVDEAKVPDALPEWSAAPGMLSVRIPRRLKSVIDAKVEVEDISFAAYMELLVWEDINRPARDPEQVRKALRAMRKQTIGMEMLDKEFGA